MKSKPNRKHTSPSSAPAAKTVAPKPVEPTATMRPSWFARHRSALWSWFARHRSALWSALFLLLAVGAGTALRVRTTFDDPNFNVRDARPLLRSDPGLLHYITERIVENGGWAPADFGADQHLEYPALSDIPAMFTVGQEFVIAWGYLAFGGDMPLHVFAVWLMSFFASLAIVGVFGLAFELTKSVRWAVLAGLVYLLLLGNYRTIGFILIREDFSLPWLALHFYALARAVRLQSRGAILATALTLVIAAGTWHAMGFMLTMEAVVLLGWYLRSGENFMAHRDAWLGLAVVFLGGLTIPVLRAKGFLMSLPVLIAISLALTAWLQRSGRLTALRARFVAPCIVVVLVLALRFIAGGQSDYSHVIELMTAKVVNRGVLPLDPKELSFDSRLLWQGPFATATWNDAYGFLGGGLALIAIALVWGCAGWLRKRGDSRVLVLMGLVVAGSVSAILVRRTVVLPAMLIPVVAACCVQRLTLVPARILVLVVFFVFQVRYFYIGIESYQCPWYHPPARGVELAEVVRWAEANIPAEEAIACDFETGTAVLAHGHHPILVQPKYETAQSRLRIEEFSDAFMHGTLEQYRQLLIENKCRFVLANRDFWGSNRYLAGIPLKANWRPDPRTPFANFCNPDPNVFEHLPGFRLVFRTADLFGPGHMRIFELVEE